MSVATVLKPAEANAQRQQAAMHAITSNPNRMGGEPVIGTERMPVTTLLDYLMAGYTLEQFSQEFGTPTENCRAALRVLRDAIDDELLTDIIATQVDY